MSANLPKSIEVEPLISYPQKAEVGKTYVMTIDLRHRETDATWPYDVEEYGVDFFLDSFPLFKSEAVGDPSVVLHRFGGTYGPAMFMLTASETEMSGNMRLTLVNESGVPIDVIEIRDIQITREALESELSDVSFTKTVPVPDKPAAPREPKEVLMPSPLAPRGFKLRHTFGPYPNDYPRVAISWSPGGKKLALVSGDIDVWDAETGLVSLTIEREIRVEVEESAVYSPTQELLAVAEKDAIEFWDTRQAIRRRRAEQAGSSSIMSWSPDGKRLAFSSPAAITILEMWTPSRSTLPATGPAWSTAWSPEGQKLASAGGDHAVRIWNPSTGQLLRVLEGHTGESFSVAWSHDGRWLASGAADHRIIIWDAETGAPVFILSEHKSVVSGLSFSADDTLLASRAMSDGSILLWRCDRWERVASFNEPVVWSWVANPAFHPSLPALATVDDKNQVHIWDLDLETLLGSEPTQPASAAEVVHYSSAKVVLLGDTGVGKSGLANALVNKSFTPTDSTHGCQIWRLNVETITAPDQTKITRDIFLWDLAGQPNSRLLQPAQLTDTVMALIVFDVHRESNPFGSVRYWGHVVRNAEKLSGGPITKIMVAARTDLAPGGFREQFLYEPLREELGFSDFVVTSAKNDSGIDALAQAIRRSIDWTKIPVTITSAILSELREFILRERESGVVVVTSEELYRSFLKGRKQTATQATQAEFMTSIGHLSTHGLIRHLPVGDFVLLKPEFISMYGSAIINAAREEPEGLGSISEAAIRYRDFRISDADRAPAEQEQVILLNVVEMLLNLKVAWRENTASGPMLVFPSLQSRESPESIEVRRVSVIFNFQGILESVYATLVVGLYHSGIVSGKEIWKNTALFTSTGGGACGISLKALSEDEGELSLFHESGTSDNTKIFFERFVWSHLRTHAIPETIKRRKIFVCSNCSTPLSELSTNRRRERGFDWISCPVCDTRISLADPVSSLNEDVDSDEEPPVVPASQRLTIFLSSTMAESKVAESLTRLGHRISVVTDPGEPPESAESSTQRAIREADLYLLIVGWNFDYIPFDTGGGSMVEREYDIALDLKPSILVFLADEGFRKQASRTKQLDAFREKLLANHIVTYFSGKADLERKVVSAVAEFASLRADERAKNVELNLPPEVPQILKLPAELIDLPQVKRLVSSINRYIEAYIYQVDQLSTLLMKHDELHKLRMAMPYEFTKSATDVRLFHIGAKFAQDLRVTLQRLEQAHTGRSRIDQRKVNDEKWIENLSQHLEELDHSLSTTDIQKLAQSLQSISDDLVAWQRSINTLMPQKARELTLTAVLGNMAVLTEIIREKSTYRVTEVIEKNRQLLLVLESDRNDRRHEFMLWQRIEDWSRLLNTDDLSAFEEAWPRFKRDVEQQFPAFESGEPSLKSALEWVNSALLLKDTSLIATALNRFRQHCLNRYYYAFNDWRGRTIQAVEMLKSFGLNPPQ